VHLIKLVERATNGFEGSGHFLPVVNEPAEIGERKLESHSRQVTLVEFRNRVDQAIANELAERGKWKRQTLTSCYACPFA
jgi:hypothetical protein